MMDVGLECQIRIGVCMDNALKWEGQSVESNTVNVPEPCCSGVESVDTRV